MIDRRDLRVVTAAILDVPGVVAVRVDLGPGLLHVEGLASAALLAAAVRACGFTVAEVR